MKFKKSNLPAPLLCLATENRRPTEGRYGVTELNGSPRIAQLRRRHWDEIEVDPSDNLWMVFGKLLHSQMESRVGAQALAEERIVIPVNERFVAGVPDHYEDGIITEYKFVSVWAVKNGVKLEWSSQLNVYAYLFESLGFPVGKIQVCCIYRDWSQTQADRDKEYPRRAEVLPVPLWAWLSREKHIRDRIALHTANEVLPDSELTPCTDEERWCVPGKFAVMKQGNKRAVKLFDDEAGAKELAETDKKLFVEKRPTEYKRCARCEVRNWCNQVPAGQTPDESCEAAGL